MAAKQENPGLLSITKHLSITKPRFERDALVVKLPTHYNMRPADDYNYEDFGCIREIQVTELLHYELNPDKYPRG